MSAQISNFIDDINKAFSTGDKDFLINHVTDDVKWTTIGQPTIEGKDAFVQAIEYFNADAPAEIITQNIITNKNNVAVDGVAKKFDKISGETKSFAFVDIYKFKGSKKKKIQEFTSYVIEMND